MMQKSECSIGWSKPTMLHSTLAEIGIIIGLTLLVVLSYISGLNCKPVAEDFDCPEASMELGPGRQFRPLYALPRMLLYCVAGSPTKNTEIFHLVSLCIHAATTVMVFYFSRYLIVLQTISVIVAFTFALYPRHHETVFWPAASAHLIMTLLLLSSINSYIKWRQTEKKRWWVISAIFFGLAILSSEAAVMGIVLLLIYEFFWRWEKLGSDWLYKALAVTSALLPFVIIVGGYLGLLVIARGGLSNFSSSITDTSFYRIRFGLDQIREFGGYLSYTLFLLVPLRTIDSTLYKLGMLIVTLLFFGSLFIWGTRLLRFGIIWIVVTFIPIVLFVPFGNADRYFYLPSVGFCLVIAGLFQMVHNFILDRFGGKSIRPILGIEIVATILYVAVMFNTIQDRSQEWRIAGEMVDRILSQVYAKHPTVDPSDTFYILGLPKQYKQARFMGDGTRSALRAHYGQPSLKVFTGDHPDLLSAVIQAIPDGAPKNGIFVYVYQDGNLRDYSFSFNDPAVRRMLEAFAIFP